MFMDEIYKCHPDIRNHPDYRFHYFYTDYPNESMYLLVFTSPSNLSNELTHELRGTLNSFKDVFGFIDAAVITSDDWYSRIQKDYDKLVDTIRGSKFSFVLTEIW